VYTFLATTVYCNPTENIAKHLRQSSVNRRPAGMNELGADYF
jgi:hypothetical protein